jgi:Tol biopolymer transport system component
MQKNDSHIYPVLGWSTDQISTGVWGGDKVILDRRVNGPPLEDIRNCTVATAVDLCALTGLNKMSHSCELWTVRLDGEQAQLLVKTNYILMQSIAPSGDHICYIADPIDPVEGASLYLYDRASAQSTLLVEKAVQRDCVPSWSPASDSIVYHTRENAVLEWDLEQKEATYLFEGGFPMVSPDGSSIAFKKAGHLFIRDNETREMQELPVPSGFWQGTVSEILSWSRDSRMLMIAENAGIFGYDLAFSVIEVTTAKYRRISHIPRGQRGLQFI